MWVLAHKRQSIRVGNKLARWFAVLKAGLSAIGANLARRLAAAGTLGLLAGSSGQRGA